MQFGDSDYCAIVFKMNTSANYTYCNLYEFSEAYKEIHPYLCLVVCIFGSLANIINICVLTTKEMRWPTNFILTGLAIADLLVMLDYIPFIQLMYTEKKYGYFTYSKAVYFFFHALFAQICHFISCTLTILLAVWRYIAITLPQNAKIWCNNYRTLVTIILAYSVCPIISLPIYFSIYIASKPNLYYLNGTTVPTPLQSTLQPHEYINTTIYYLNSRGNMGFWVYSVIIKFIPCLLLVILSERLIAALIKTKERRRKLLNKKPILSQDVTSKKTKTKEVDASEQQADRTTKMLLAVLLLFLITELPQAILGVLGALIGETFNTECYQPLGK